MASRFAPQMYRAEDCVPHLDWVALWGLPSRRLCSALRQGCGLRFAVEEVCRLDSVASQDHCSGPMKDQRVGSTVGQGFSLGSLAGWAVGCVF